MKTFARNLYLQVETAFDRIVGAIEDIVIDDRFQDLQTDLLEKHFHHFDVSFYSQEMRTDHRMHKYLNQSCEMSRR